MDGVDGVYSSFGLTGEVWGTLVMLGVAFGLPRIFWVLQPNQRCRKAPQGTPSERKEPQAPSKVILPTSLGLDPPPRFPNPTHHAPRYPDPC